MVKGWRVLEDNDDLGLHPRATPSTESVGQQANVVTPISCVDVNA